ncbi:MAG: hypothetical protein DRJ40_02865 [Thermoprotei archaeon]|nr:MAG: hypothetical protein DRJ40_02865 [Thermoprotei archaeon]
MWVGVVFLVGGGIANDLDSEVDLECSDHVGFWSCCVSCLGWVCGSVLGLVLLPRIDLIYREVSFS